MTHRWRGDVMWWSDVVTYWCDVLTPTLWCVDVTWWRVDVTWWHIDALTCRLRRDVLTCWRDSCRCCYCARALWSWAQQASNFLSFTRCQMPKRQFSKVTHLKHLFEINTPIIKVVCWETKLQGSWKMQSEKFFDGNETEYMYEIVKMFHIWLTHWLQTDTKMSSSIQSCRLATNAFSCILRFHCCLWKSAVPTRATEGHKASGRIRRGGGVGGPVWVSYPHSIRISDLKKWFRCVLSKNRGVSRSIRKIRPSENPLHQREINSACRLSTK